MDYIRIGDKFISISKINRNVDEILELRCRGYSQQEVSRILNIDRTFISRLEGLGEVRREEILQSLVFRLRIKKNSTQN
jgi:transcriptional regulator